MTLSVELSTEQEAKLRERAAAVGKDVAAYISGLIETVVSDAHEPARVTDPHTQQPFVLVPAEEYDRMAQAEELAALRETYPAQDAVARANGWDDPEMDIYNDYDAHSGSIS